MLPRLVSARTLPPKSLSASELFFVVVGALVGTTSLRMTPLASFEPTEASSEVSPPPHPPRNKRPAIATDIVKKRIFIMTPNTSLCLKIILRLKAFAQRSNLAALDQTNHCHSIG